MWVGLSVSFHTPLHTAIFFRLNSRIPERQHSPEEQTGFISSSLCKGFVVREAWASSELSQSARDEPGVWVHSHEPWESIPKLFKNIIGDEMGLSKDLGLACSQTAFLSV